MVNVRNKHSIHGDCSPAIVSLGGLLSQDHRFVPISCLKIGIVHRSLGEKKWMAGEKETEPPQNQLKATKEKPILQSSSKQFGGLTQVQPYHSEKSTLKNMSVWEEGLELEENIFSKQLVIKMFQEFPSLNHFNTDVCLSNHLVKKQKQQSLKQVYTWTF